MRSSLSRPLTVLQVAALLWLVEFQEARGRGATMDEVAAGLGCSASVARHRAQALARRYVAKIGLVHRRRLPGVGDRRRRRGFMVVVALPDLGFARVVATAG